MIPQPGAVARPEHGPQDTSASPPPTTLQILRPHRTIRLGEVEADLGRHPSLWSLLQVLVRERMARPGECISTRRLITIQWPNGTVRWRSGRSRIYMAISKLRRMGLGPILEKRAEGYRICPECQVREGAFRACLAPGPSWHDGYCPPAHTG
jgi:hypothetical protein